MFKNNLLIKENLSLKELSTSYIDLSAQIIKMELEQNQNELNKLYSRIDECKIKLSKCFDKYSDGLLDLYSVYLVERLKGTNFRNYAFIRDNGNIYLHSYILANDRIYILTKYDNQYYINRFDVIPEITSFDIGREFNCLSFDINNFDNKNIIEESVYINYKLMLKVKPKVNVQNLIQFINNINNCISYVSIEKLNIVLNLPKNLSFKSIDFLGKILNLSKTTIFKIKQDYISLVHE